MKRFLALVISSILVLPLYSGAFIYAQTSEQSTQDATTTTESTTEAKAISERIAKIKTEFKTKLATAEKLKIESKCVASQVKIKSHIVRIKGIETSRSEIHKNLLSRLTGLSEKLKTRV